MASRSSKLEASCAFIPVNTPETALEIFVALFSSPRLNMEKIDAILQKIGSDPESDDVKSTEVELWEKIRKKSLGGRRTGLGITGEGDMLAALGLTYGSDEAIAVAFGKLQSGEYAAYGAEMKQKFLQNLGG